MVIFDIFLALACVFIWGITFVVVKWGVGLAPPLLLCAFRFFFVCFPAVFFIRRPPIALRYIISYGIAVSIIQFGLIFSAIYFGLPAGLSSILMQSQVFVTLFLGYFFFNQRPTLTQTLCALIAFSGILLIGVNYFMDTTLTAFLMAIGAGCSWGVGNMIVIKASRVYTQEQLALNPNQVPEPLDMFAFVIWSCLIAPIPLLLLSFWLEGSQSLFLNILSEPTWQFMLCVIYLAGPSHIGGFGIWSRLISKYTPALIAPFALLIPVISLIAAYIVLDETIELNEFIGALLVLGALGYNLLSDRMNAKRPDTASHLESHMVRPASFQQSSSPD